MELTLYRSYYPDGTNGWLYINEVFQCYTIELPWHNNAIQRSCIPEGKYVIRKRWSPKHGDHLLVADVPGRSLILIHPANNAVLELNGCIAPVTLLLQPGKGLRSKAANTALCKQVFTAIKKEPVYLIVKNKIT